MLDNRNIRDIGARGRCGCGFNCVNTVIWILSSLFFLTVGAIIGAYASDVIIESIAAVAVLAIGLFIATVLVIFIARCRCRERQNQ